MSGIFTKVRNIHGQFPLIRGMVSYAIIWPTCSIVQEYIENGTSIENADWARATRFGIFGTFFMAPVFYGWMKYTSRFFKGNSLRTAITRAAIEQISYSPLAMAYFFFGMSLLEMKPIKTCVNEVREKLWPTYKIGVVFWPTAQTLNFYFISEKNRIVFVSAASFVWTVYLAHMKSKEQENEMVVDLKLSDMEVTQMELPEMPKLGLPELIPEAELTEKVTPEVELTEKLMPEAELTEKLTPEVELTEKLTPDAELTEKLMPAVELTESLTSEVELTEKLMPEMELTEMSTPEVELPENMAKTAISEENSGTD